MQKQVNKLLKLFRDLPDGVRKPLSIFIAVLLGLGCGLLLILTIQFRQNELVKSREQKLGILTPKQINLLSINDLKHKSYENFDVYYQTDAETELKTIDYIITKSNIKSLIDENNEKPQLYLIPGIDNKSLHEEASAKEGTKFMDTGAVFTSGRYVYLTRDYIGLISSPEEFDAHFVAGTYYAQFYNKLNDKSLDTQIKNKKSYDLTKVDSIKSFSASLHGENDSKWQNPYPQKTAEYEKITSVCKNIDSVEHLLICELIIYQYNKSDLLPPNSQKFISKEFKLDTNGIYKAAGAIQSGEVKNYFKDLKLKEGKIKFTAWDVPTFSSQAYQVKDNSIYYTDVTKDQLTNIKKQIEENGWSFVEQTETLKDDQFKFNTFKLVYSKEDALLKSQLSILVMDTATMNTDCIIEGIGAVYCDQRSSIHKNSGYYIHIEAGQFAKYQIEE